jgi:hypothetical protein
MQLCRSARKGAIARNACRGAWRVRVMRHGRRNAVTIGVYTQNVVKGGARSARRTRISDTSPRDRKHLDSVFRLLTVEWVSHQDHFVIARLQVGPKTLRGRDPRPTGISNRRGSGRSNTRVYLFCWQTIPCCAADSHGSYRCVIHGKGARGKAHLSSWARILCRATAAEAMSEEKVCRLCEGTSLPSIWCDIPARLE